MLVSFGFAIIAFNMFLNARAITRGAFGVRDVERPAIGGVSFDGELAFLALRPGVPGDRRPDILVNRDLVLRASAEGHSRGRAGDRGLRLPGNPLQAGRVGRVGHDGGRGRRPVRKLDDLRRSQLLHPAGVDAARLHCYPGRARHHLGVAARGNGLRAPRGGDAFPAVLPFRICGAGPARSYSASCWSCSCCSGPRGWSGGTSCEPTPGRSRRGIHPQ